MKTILTKQQKDFIHDNYLKMGAKTMGKKLSVGNGIIVRYMKKNSLVVPDEIKKQFRYINKEVKSSISQHDQFLKDNYLKIPLKTMARMLGKNHDVSIRTRLRQLGLVVPKELAEQRKKDGYYKKGSEPANKGQKMTEEQKAKCAHTFFKKGNLPYNTAEKDGEIRIRTDHKNRKGRQYKWIRISLGKWEMLNVYLWKLHYGEVPKGHVVAFKDGDSLNCVIENLELITLEENMKRNSLHNLPQDLKEVVQAKGRLVRAINKYTK